jgi:hypothetical protein
MSEECKNCKHKIPKINYKNCPYCGQRTNVKKLDFGTVIDEFVSYAFHFENNKLAFTIYSMIKNPGKVLYGYVLGERKKYQNPVSYFFTCALLYYFFVHYFAEPNHVYIGVINTLSNYQRISLLVGLSFIGWLCVGIPEQNIFEIFLCICLIYGTSFITSSIFILLQWSFIDDIKTLPELGRYIVSDLPSALTIFYFIGSFMKAAKVNLFRLVPTILIGYWYYVYFIGELIKK